MPRNVRNFWMEASIDGRQTDVTGGPVNKEGGLDIDIYQRNEGTVLKSINVHCWNGTGKKLFLRVTDVVTNEILFERETVR